MINKQMQNKKEEKEQEIKRIDRKEREMQERQERREKIANVQADENISTPTVKPKRNRVSKPIDAYEFEYGLRKSRKMSRERRLSRLKD